MTGILAALASVALAGLVALAGYSGGNVLVAAVALAVLVVAIGWGVLLELPDVRGTSVVVALTGWSGLVVATATRTQARPLAGFVVVIAFSVLAAFAHELLRRDGRVQLVESVTGTLAGQVVAVLGAGWVLLPGTALGVDGVAVAAGTVGAVRLASGVRRPAGIGAWAPLVAGAVVGTAIAVPLEGGTLQAAVVSAVTVAAVVAGVDRMLATQPNAGTPIGLLAGAAAPVTAAGTVAYAVARLLAG